MQASQGNRLVEIDSLIFSEPSVKTELATSDPLPFSETRNPRFGQFQVTIPESVLPGRYEIRVRGRNGLSNPRAFLVTDQAHEITASVSHDPLTPTPLALNTFVHAKSAAATVDYYQLELDQPSTLHVEVVAQRLDSRLIPAFKILDANGHQIGSSRGADGVDVSWSSEAPLEAGKYLLQLNDFIYRGGVEFHYQLLASRDPQPQLLGSNKTSQGQLPTVWATSRVTDSVDGPAKFLDTPITNENQSDGRQPSEALPLPYVGSDFFEPATDHQGYQFHAEKGQVIAVEVAADRLGEPSDARILVQRVEPKEPAPPVLHDVTNLDDSQTISDGAMNLFSKDPTGLFTAPETALYRVSVRDLDIGRTLRSRKRFAVRIGPPQPSFELVAYRPHAHSDLKQSQPTGTRLFRGGTEIIRLLVIRKDGWTGPIHVRCENLPEGVSAAEITIGSNQTIAQIPITASEMAPSAFAPIRLIGRNDEGTIERTASAAVIQWGKGNGRDFIQTRQTDTLWVSVSEQDQIPISVSFGNSQVVEVKKGESVKIPVQLQRREGAKAACVARARHFPPGTKAADLTIPADKNEGEIEIKTEASSVPGTYSLWLQVETKIKIEPNPQAVQRAQIYRNHLGSLLEDPAQQAQQESIKAAIAEADKTLEAAKTASKEKEITVFLSTNSATLRVLDP